jgi:hypothetical protein
LSGHCTPIPYESFQPKYDFDTEPRHDWNCPDASDDIGLLRITQLSEHNSKIINQSDLEQRKAGLIRRNSDSDFTAFARICNATKEYGCILANVNDPLNLAINRPCINLTQIGDGIIDCYGGLDERNLLTCGNNIYEQRGFDFHCSDQQCISYYNLCIQRCSNKTDSLLCDQLPSFRRSSCLYFTKPPQEICRYVDSASCDKFGTKYYCDLTRQGK